METLHLSIDIEKSPSEVYEMISTLGGLRSWLTRDTTGAPKKGSELRFGFGPDNFTSVLVKDAKMNKSVSWDLVASAFSKNGEGIDTTVVFKLSEGVNRGTHISITHAGWSEVCEFYRISGYQWEKSLVSLKKACETGTGDPVKPTALVSRKASGWFPVT